MRHQMVMQRKFLLRSLNGHTLQFLPGEPLYVPTEVVPEASQMGAVMVDPTEAIGSDQIEDGELVEPASRIALSDADRQEALESSLKTILSVNDSEHFTGSGYPKIGIVRSTSGVADARASEVASIWDALRTPEDSD